MGKKGDDWGEPWKAKKGKGGGKASKQPKKPKQVKPEAKLVRQASRLERAWRDLPETAKATGRGPEIEDKIRGSLKGYSADQVKKVAKEAGVDYGKLKRFVPDEGGGGPLGAVADLGGSALGWTLDKASRPGQGVVSAFAEWSRQAEKNPTQLGPISLRFGVSDPGEIAEAAKEGVTGERRDTPGSIAKEAGKIRQRQGAGTKSFGVIPGTDIRRGLEVIPNAPKWVRGAEHIGLDVGGAAALDPLTYATLGASGVAKTGIKQVGRMFGPERAAAVRGGGMKALTAGERATVAENVTPRVAQGLKGARGGLGVRLPNTPRQIARTGHLLAPPRTVLPFPKGLAAGAGKAVSSVPGAKAVERAFSPRAGIRQAERAGRLPEGTASAVDEARVRWRGAISPKVEADVNRLVTTIKDAKASRQELEEIVGPALDVGGARVAVPPRLQPVVDEFRGVLDELGEEQVRTGLLKPPDVAEDIARQVDAPAPVRPEEYNPRKLTPEGTKYFEAKERAIMGPTAGRPNIGQAPSRATTARTFQRDKPIRQINEEYAREAGGPIFEPNPLRATAERTAEARRDVATQDFIGDVLKLTDNEGNALVMPFDEFRTRLPEGQAITAAGERQIPAGYTKITIPRHGEFVVDKAVAPELSKLGRLLSSDKELNGLLRFTDKWMALWKSYATVPLPFGMGFHMRNSLGNVMLNWLADVNNPADYIKAYRLQRKIGKGMKEGDPLRYLQGADAQMAQEALDRGILKSGFFDADLPETATRATHFGEARARKVARGVNPFSTENVAIKVGRAFGSGVEENARLAHFIAKTRELGNLEDAAASARKYLFDYSDLTSIEQDIFKRVIPFYTFNRKNLPLWVEAAVKDPARFSRIQQSRVALASEADDKPTGPLPQFALDRGGVILPQGVNDALAKVPGLGFEEGTPAMFTPDLPVVAASEILTPLTQLAGGLPGANKIPGRPQHPEGLSGPFRDLSSLFGGGAPGAALGATQALGAEREFFSGRPFFPGERVEAPPYLLGPVGEALGLSQSRDLGEGKGSQRTISRRAQFLIESLMPGFTKVRTAIPTSEKDEEKKARRRLSMFTGLQLYPLGPETREAEAQRRLSIVQQLMDDLRARGVTVPEGEYTTTKKRKGSKGSKRRSSDWGEPWKAK